MTTLAMRIQRWTAMVLLWGMDAPGVASLHHPHAHWSSFILWPQDGATLVNILEQHPEFQVGQSLLARQPEGTGRGDESCIASVRSIVPDVDTCCSICLAQGRGHADWPPDLATALAVARTVSPPPSCVIGSPHGNGTPILSLTEAVSVAAARVITRAWRLRLNDAWRAQGWAELDPCDSPARLVRLPGSIWWKPGHDPGLCRLLGPTGEEVTPNTVWMAYRPRELAASLGIPDLDAAEQAEVERMAERPSSLSTATDAVELDDEQTAPPTEAQMEKARGLLRAACREVGDGGRRRHAAFRFCRALYHEGLEVEQILQHLGSKILDSMNAARPFGPDGVTQPKRLWTMKDVKAAVRDACHGPRGQPPQRDWSRE